MARPKIHPRVMLRHPELSEKDVLHAWEHAIASLPRVSKIRTSTFPSDSTGGEGCLRWWA